MTDAVAVFAAVDPGVVQLVLGFVGLSGLGGLIAAFFKLKPETNLMAVQSMEKSNTQIAAEREYWERQAKECRDERDRFEARVEELEVEKNKLERENARMRRVIEG